ncbi:DUF2510 domain-containing protein [Mycolicibacterium phocaicum]|uniref:DUF2510 domain-containing protein n=1 Tax=Mycolicibacterium phocaicum TaxID=319706 RepID=UPI001CFC08D3|nr:DUF2510 domain-containing protein [Mycolicibacterium phocaicum]UCZ61464.1 DUF2510 domain-containing protein [Mycolicibacterium phocaicum]
MTTAGPEPGWYIDPDGSEGQQRYWNGSEWTEHRTAGSPEPEPVPVRIVKSKRAPLPKPAIIAIAVAVLGAVIWGVVSMQQSARQQIDDFHSVQMQGCMKRENYKNSDYTAHLKTCNKEVYGKDIG